MLVFAIYRFFCNNLLLSCIIQLNKILLFSVCIFTGSDHRDAFTLAFKLLWNQVSISSRMCEPLILFLTDGQDSDPVLCRPAAYFGTEEGALFVPGPRCLYDFNQVAIAALLIGTTVDSVNRNTDKGNIG